MKTFKITVQQEANHIKVMELLQKLALEGIIEYQESTGDDSQEPHAATENQVQEMIDEAELGPYYSEKEAKQILNL